MLTDWGQVRDWNRQLMTQGYVLAKGAIPPQVAQSMSQFVYGRLTAYRQTFADKTGVDLEDSPAVQAYAQKLEATGQYGLLEKDLQHLVRGEFPLPVRLADEIRQITQAPELHALLKLALQQESLRAHYPPMVRFKQPGQAQANVPMHQDGPYNAHLRNFFTVWVPLCQITDACGGVVVLPRSQELGPLEHKHQVIWGHYVQDNQRLAPFERKHIEMELGDALLFGSLTLHASHPNTSDMARCSIDYRFFGPDTPTEKHYLDIASGQVIEPTP